MKSINLFFVSLIATLLLFACQSVDIESNNQDKIALDVSLSLEQDSRASYSSDFALNFSPNDKMEIMERSLMDVTTLVYDYDKGQFLGKIYVPRVAESYEVCAHVGANSYTSEKATFEIAQSQIGVAKVFLAGMWQLSHLQNVSLQMSQMSSMLAFTLNPTENGVSEIILESIGGEMIAGTVDYDYASQQYTINGTSSKISVKPLLNPTKPTQYVINVLPVTLSKGVFLTIVDNRGKRMRLTLNYGQSFNFDLNKVIILPDTINQQSFSMTLGKVYSSYTVDGVATPNNELDGRSIWVESGNIYGLSSYLVGEAGYYVGNTKYATGISTEGQIQPLTLGNAQLKSYKVKAYIVDVDGVEYCSDEKSVDVTGIPYTYSFASSTEASIKAAGWDIISPRAVEDNCVKMSNATYLTTPEFYTGKSLSLIAVVGCASNESTSTTGLGKIFISKVAGNEIAPKEGMTIAPDYTMGWPGSAERAEKTSEAFTITNEQSRVQFSTDAGTIIVLDQCYSLITDVTLKYAE